MKLFPQRLPVLSQKPVISGKMYHIQSDILQEKRPYAVFLPEGYGNTSSEERSYSVIYVLDGEANFEKVISAQQILLEEACVDALPAIIIGIMNVDRERDYTPTHAPVVFKGKERFYTSGAADDFLRFLHKELFQEIDNRYRTNGKKMLVGHSFGGLFALYTLISKADVFDNYLVIDPSLWWDDEYVNRLFKTKGLSKNRSNKPQLYLATAGTNGKTIEKRNHEQAIFSFVSFLESDGIGEILKVDLRRFERENHGSIISPAIYDGLRSLCK
ncbi:alpha/beta hydrolase [Sphingobacterium sp. LRF_L2]|uniref:alpha/beta hydrolase n=1 Tax=Sphingobacterium sp. LRF_L2 TaxID=3369421 RepID=UPI003F5EE2BA